MTGETALVATLLVIEASPNERYPAYAHTELLPVAPSFIPENRDYRTHDLFESRPSSTSLSQLFTSPLKELHRENSCIHFAFIPSSSRWEPNPLFEVLSKIITFSGGITLKKEK